MSEAPLEGDSYEIVLQQNEQGAIITISTVLRWCCELARCLSLLSPQSLSLVRPLRSLAETGLRGRTRAFSSASSSAQYEHLRF